MPGADSIALLVQEQLFSAAVRDLALQSERLEHEEHEAHEGKEQARDVADQIGEPWILRELQPWALPGSNHLGPFLLP